MSTFGAAAALGGCATAYHPRSALWIQHRMDAFELFVYGSLRTGGSNARMLRGCERLGTARVAGALYDLEDYPALVLDGSGEVEGEVWRCPAGLLPRLDRFELVHEGVYRRVRVQAGAHDCWTYVAGPALASCLTAAQRIASGRWPPAAS